MLFRSVTLALAACAGPNGVSIVEDQQTGFFASEEYARDASTGPMLVVVRGAAFGYDPTTLANLVVNNMQGADWGPHARFTPVAGPNTARMYFYVMAINPPRDLTGAALCARSLPRESGPLPDPEAPYRDAATSQGRAVSILDSQAESVGAPATLIPLQLLVGQLETDDHAVVRRTRAVAHRDARGHGLRRGLARLVAGELHLDAEGLVPGHVALRVHHPDEIVEAVGSRAIGRPGRGENRDVEFHVDIVAIEAALDPAHLHLRLRGDVSDVAAQAGTKIGHAAELAHDRHARTGRVGLVGTAAARKRHHQQCRPPGPVAAGR